MEAEVTRLLDAFDAMRKEANVNACFGAPVTTEGRTVIPVARVGYGFGMGTGHPRLPPGGSGEEHLAASPGGRGGGGGMTSSPIGLIEIEPEGVHVEPILDQQRVAIVAMLVGAWAIFWLTHTLTAIFGTRE